VAKFKMTRSASAHPAAPSASTAAVALAATAYATSPTPCCVSSASLSAITACGGAGGGTRLQPASVVGGAAATPPADSVSAGTAVGAVSTGVGTASDSGYGGEGGSGLPRRWSSGCTIAGRNDGRHARDAKEQQLQEEEGVHYTWQAELASLARAASVKVGAEGQRWAPPRSTRPSATGGVLSESLGAQTYRIVSKQAAGKMGGEARRRGGC